MYSISDLERISGVKAHTIRIWEKRYSLLNPERTEGNHRLYSDRDLMKLLNVEQLISSGYKISKIAEWRWEKIKSEVRELFLQEERDLPDVAFYNNQWLQSALNYDEDKFIELYKQLRSQMSFIRVWESYLVPAFEHMGQLWLTEVIAPAEEHFFSQLVRRKILVESDKLPLPGKGNPQVVLFLPPNEYHELGLLVTEYLLREQGIAAINLGPDLPIVNIQKILADQNINTLITFIHGIKMDKAFLEYMISLESEGRDVVFNGRLNTDDESTIKTYGHTQHPKTILEFKKYILKHPKFKS